MKFYWQHFPAMSKFPSLVCLLLVCLAALAAAQGSTNRTSLWKTLSGTAPLVIARGGFSGIFPDSSTYAYSLALIIGLPNVILWCDVQLTKDQAGICFPDLRLNNASNIADVFKGRDNNYLVNGVPTQGWFSVDFTFNDLSNIFLTQSIYSRSDKFDNQLSVLTVQDVAKQLKPPGFWLNIQHDAFFSQRNLSMRSFVISATRSVIIDYISSPEVNFLRSIMGRKPRRTKLVFRFLGLNNIEPSTNQTYGSLLNNLTFVKTFASGILVPKSYIWPVGTDLYLMPPSSLVLDAHSEGLEVFASEFANDVPFAYDYRYDPVAEYLSFIENGNFSVDGVLSDFPITPSAAIDCFSHTGNRRQEKPLVVISHEGASGDYPGCTDAAYTQAISDGVDVLDCPVQMSKDGVPFCLGSINLIDSTNAAQSSFSTLSMTIPELAVSGIFSFKLTWNQIQSLTPAISNPYRDSILFRNPKSRSAGKLMTLSDFLALAKNATSVSGVLIGIENAAYLAARQGLGVIDTVLDTLSRAGYNNQTDKKVMIHSTNSSVLLNFKEKSNYELVYEVDESIRDAMNSTILDIKNFAKSVIIQKSSVFPSDAAFLTSITNVVPKLQAFDIPVYVKLFRNEFVSQAWDFMSDATVEINTFVVAAGIDGVITDFPVTAVRYRRNRCLGLGTGTPNCMKPIEPGSLMQLIPSQNLPPAEAPNPVLTDSDVVEAALPPVMVIIPNSDSGNGSIAAGPTTPTPPNGRPKVVACIFMSNLAILFVTLMLV